MMANRKWNLSSSSSSESDDDKNDEKSMKVEQETFHPVIQPSEGGHDKSVCEFDVNNGFRSERLPKSETNTQLENLSVRKIGETNDEDGYGDESDEELDIQWEDGFSSCSSNREEDVEDVEKEEELNECKENIKRHTHAQAVKNMNLKPISLEINHQPVKNNTEKKGGNPERKKQKTLHKLTNLSESTKELLISIHRSHLLCLTCRSIYASRCCSNNVLLNAVYSLIPDEYDSFSSSSNQNKTKNYSVPTKSHIEKLCRSWFFPLVNEIQQRRRRLQVRYRELGAPTSLSTTKRRQSKRQKQCQVSKGKSQNIYKKSGGEEGGGILSIEVLLTLIRWLSPSFDEGLVFQNDDDIDINSMSDLINLLTPHCKAQILVALGRSLGWRVRYVTSLEAIGTELTVSHPLLTMTVISNTIFHRFSSSNNPDVNCKSTTEGTASKEKRKYRKRRRNCDDNDEVQKESFEATDVESTGNNGIGNYEAFAWVEIREISGRWIHVDVERELIDMPLEMESYQRIPNDHEVDEFQMKSWRSQKRKSRRRRHHRPFSYVLAIEHDNDINCDSDRDEIIPARLTDVTGRYANRWSDTLFARGVQSKKEIMRMFHQHAAKPCGWWKETLERINSHLGDHKKHTHDMNNDEKSIVSERKNCDRKSKKQACHKFTKKKKERLLVSCDGKKGDEIFIDDEERHNVISKNHQSSMNKNLSDRNKTESSSPGLLPSIREPLPTSLHKFKNHPLYALPSQLNQNEVLSPKAKFCGMFKGQLVYMRNDVSVAHSPKQWLYLGRTVNDEDLRSPVKEKKRRKKRETKNFVKLDTYNVGIQQDISNKNNVNEECEEDYYENGLFGIWQTRPWSPPYISSEDPLPINKYNNIEKALLNPGLVHLTQTKISLLAKKLGIPYAPCLVGFEGHQSNRTPQIRGIVVHNCNVDILNEAHIEYTSNKLEKDIAENQEQIYSRWRRLTTGVLTKDRLERKYSKTASRT